MTSRRWTILISVALALILVGVVVAVWFMPTTPPRPPETEPPDGPAWFADVTSEVGLDFVHDAGPVGGYFMPQQVGSGAAFFDFDNDGLVDILFLQNGGPASSSTNRLYRQFPAHTFKDVSKGSGLDINGHNMGVAVGDINNDGLLDVLITQYDGVKLFVNQGNGVFRDTTTESGLSSPSWGASAAFFDYDRDGWLDLVVVCYVDYDPTWPCKGPSNQRDYCAPRTFKGRVSRLFRNRGGDKAVRFEDVTQKSGLGAVRGPGLGVVCADFDGDGFPDILIANDGEPNHLWINHNGRTFTEEAIRRGLAYNLDGQAQAGMGIAFGDVNGDGNLDVFITHLAQETHTLWSQSPRGLYLDTTKQSGVLKSHWRGTGFGTVFADFTNAGKLDLAIVNGAVAAQAQPGDADLGPFWRRYGQRNQLFAGDGRGGFRDVSWNNLPFCGKANVARGLLQSDFDGDGGVDLLVTTIGGRAKLFRNVAPVRGRWLSIRAVDPERKRDAIGSLIEVHAGQRRFVRWLHPAESYLCSSEPRAHFGLGSFDRYDRIEVRWPDGMWETFPGGSADQRIELQRGANKKGKS